MSEKENNTRLKFFNEAVEYIDKFDNQKLKNRVIISPFGSVNNNSTFLRDEMINELNNLREIIRSNNNRRLRGRRWPGTAMGTSKL